MAGRLLVDGVVLPRNGAAVAAAGRLLVDGVVLR
jgi:hypothetical protein